MNPNNTTANLFTPSEPAPASTVHGGTSQFGAATGSEANVTNHPWESKSIEAKEQQAEVRRTTRSWDEFITRMREKGALIEETE